MSFGARQIAVEARIRTRAALAGLALECSELRDVDHVPGQQTVSLEVERPRPSNVFSSCVVWYARTIGTAEAPWLVRTPNGETWLCERVSFTRATTRLLSDEDRKKYPDSPRGVVECEIALAYGARRLPV